MYQKKYIHQIKSPEDIPEIARYKITEWVSDTSKLEKSALEELQKK